MSLIWATRGKSWGFRFLRSGGSADPLIDYEDVFSGLDNQSQAFRRLGDRVALRFTDPEARQDAAGRPIPHEFVLTGENARDVNSLEAGREKIWPLVADEYAQIWDQSSPPAVHD